MILYFYYLKWADRAVGMDKKTKKPNRTTELNWTELKKNKL
jgi:hypothetical protein